MLIIALGVYELEISKEYYEVAYICNMRNKTLHITNFLVRLMKSNSG